MGRVVKGARLGAGAYTVRIPEAAATPVEAEPYLGDEGSAGFDDVPVAAAAPPPPAQPVVDLEAVERESKALVDAAAADAESLLADAHGRARALVADAASRAAAITEAARAAGHGDGFAEGRAEADRQMADMLATMRNLIEMARIERQKLLAAAEPEIVKLAMGIAERVLHQQIAIDRDVVVEMAKAAIARLIDRDSITVRVNPADLDRMRDRRADLLALGDVEHLRFVEDQRVDRGGVVVESQNGGSIDARVTTQIAEARKILHIEDDVVVQPVDASSREAVFSAAS